VLNAQLCPGVDWVVDVDRGDILFDAQPIANARYLAVGASGYIENPNGAISCCPWRPAAP